MVWAYEFECVCVRVYVSKEINWMNKGMKTTYNALHNHMNGLQWCTIWCLSCFSNFHQIFVNLCGQYYYNNKDASESSASAEYVHPCTERKKDLKRKKMKLRSGEKWFNKRHIQNIRMRLLALSCIRIIYVIIFSYG